MRYRDLILKDPILRKHVSVPKIFPELSSKQVLTSSFVSGVPIDKAAVLSQQVRNAIARAMLVMTIKELFEWKFMQSDPNFSNFIYDHTTFTIHCIDFGAAREYSDQFVEGYIELVWAAANSDEEKLMEMSKQLGFLSGTDT